MRTSFQRLLSAALALCLMLSLCVPALAEEDTTGSEPEQPRATGEVDGALIRGTFSYGPHESECDLTDTYIYSDDYFGTSSYTANQHLATMSMQMAAASISSEDAETYDTKSQNVQALLKALKFQDVQVNDCYKQAMQQNTMGVAMAYKTLDDSTVLLAIVPRSAGYEKEWGGNFNVGTGDGAESVRYTTNAENFQGTDGLHAGFQLARNIALDFARRYVTDESRSNVFAGKTVKVWTMGYSRGAATANLIGAALVDDAKNAIGLTIAPENVYDYTFGTPLTVRPGEGCTPSAERYHGIHNYFSDYDPVAMVPFSNWGFKRYGQSETYNDNSRKAQMLRFLKTVNPQVYAIYTNADGKGDPDNFRGYTLGEGLTLTPSGQSITQKEFLEERIGHLTRTIATNRIIYAKDYQTVLSTFLAFYLGESDETVTAFLSGIAADKNDLMLAVTLLAFYDWADQYAASVTTDKATTAVGQLKAILPTAESNGYSDEAQTFLASETYKNFYATVTDATKFAAYMTGSDTEQTSYQSQVKATMTSLLQAGLDQAKIANDDTRRTNLLSDSSVSGLTKLIGYFVFGTDTKLAELTTPEEVQIALT